ncbi:unnamed protein product [Penicillium roqueforti FM164]|uniref:Genomic scaffold, ProqFM164S01 n=1 Tax=Penicillium roqueforti (strain FM164) TaxID=1365484 RepID=W6Q5P5_PENRF|nr:unnamed protein product [Penicillium roqueforti FM164]
MSPTSPALRGISGGRAPSKIAAVAELIPQRLYLDCRPCHRLVDSNLLPVDE